jgi:uncharacterized phage protein (TIGR02218 family)
MRVVPAQLLLHLQRSDTTTCLLLKITTSAGDHFGLTTLDMDIEYDDGEGVITYVATEGFNPSTFSTSTGLSVDNAEGYALISQATGITEQMVVAGDLDDATWRCYLINFNDLSMGHLLLDDGDIGDVSVRHGILWIPELISSGMRLKQPIGGVWSLRCRAIFGSDADSQTGCGVDVTSLWVTGAVQSVGAENNRIFTGDNITGSGQPVPFPGRIQFLTGDNAGREYATESVTSLTVTLSETTPYPIEAGDTYRIRPDCGKRFAEDCIAIWDNGVNFKGEPHTPIGDAAAASTPAAQTPRGSRFARG